MFASCVHRRVVEKVGLGVECMLMCMGNELCCGRLQCKHGRYGLSRISLASQTLSAQCIAIAFNVQHAEGRSLMLGFTISLRSV